MSDKEDFALFVSYTRTPDAELAREVERFLEAFHTSLLLERPESLPPLRICVDGSDFSMPPVAEREGRVRGVLDVVYSHLARSRELLVLCSSDAARSDWVEKESRWFIERFGAGRIRIAFTEGDAPWKDPASYCPSPILEHELHKGIAYDLRGYDQRRAKQWHQVPQFSREMVRLAADLHGRSAGDLYPSWLEAELERARRQSATMTSNARFETFAGDPAQAVLAAYQAHQLHPDESSEAGMRDAYRVAVMHHHNRRQIAQITGSGPGYLASRWKQGDLFTKTSIDGRFRLLVTERGRDGPHPPGDVFLLNNETLRVVQLLPFKHAGARVEEVAFDRATECVFVTRYFYLSVYAMDGGLLGEYDFSRHTKSPVHLLDGLFRDRWVLGAETKGGVWLVEPEADGTSTITVHREFHGDATIFTDMSPDRNRMTLVYESGKANLLELDESGQPRLRAIAEEGTLFAGFPTACNDRVVATGRNGRLRVLDIRADGVRELLNSDPLGADVDWVSWDAQTNRLALVGGDRRIHIADGETGIAIATLDYMDDVDWRNAIAMQVPREFVDPGRAWVPGEGVPFPDADLAVSAFARTGDQTWVITQHWPSEYWPEHRVHLLADGRAYFLAEGNAPIRDHDGLLHLGGSQRAFARVSELLRPFPSKGGVQCVLRTGDALWVGTPSGAYRRNENRFERITPPGVDASGLMELDGVIWIHGRTGAYAFVENKLLRVTDPFLHVATIKRAGGHVWILGKSASDSGTPVWRVDGWLASAVPDRDARVTTLFETPDAVWLAERTRMHRVGGHGIDMIDLNFEVTALQTVGRSIWCTTRQPTGRLGASGPLLRLDRDTLEPQTFELVAPSLVSAGGALFATHVVRTQWMLFGTPMGQRSLARLDEHAPRPIELGDVGVQRVMEHRGSVLLLTSAGAFSLAGDQVVQLPVPELSYSGLTSIHGYTWLFAATGAVRMRGTTVTLFETGHPVSKVTRVRGETWLLTSRDELAGGPGPAYHVKGGKAILHAPSGAGVACVVDYNDATWLLTRDGTRSGPMIRAEG